MFSLRSNSIWYKSRRVSDISSALAHIESARHIENLDRDLYRWKSDRNLSISVAFSGRGDRIWTCDPFVPNEVLYQTEPHLDNAPYYSIAYIGLSRYFWLICRFCWFPLSYGNLTGCHGLQCGLVALRCDTGTTGCVHTNGHFREERFQQQGIGHHTNIGT